MRANNDGLLIWISFGLGRVVMPTMGVYCASKWALEAAAETFRYELAELGVDSVVVEPGGYPTNFNDAPDKPASPERNEEYGTIAALGNQLNTHFRMALRGGN